MPCQCAEPKKEKVFESIELDYKNRKEYRIIEFVCGVCSRYGVEKTEKIELQHNYESHNFENYQRLF